MGEESQDQQDTETVREETTVTETMSEPEARREEHRTTGEPVVREETTVTETTSPAESSGSDED